MTGHDIIAALEGFHPDVLDLPVVLEQHPHYNATMRPCRALVFDPELREIVFLTNGPFDTENAKG